jgi:hypothetical protein
MPDHTETVLRNIAIGTVVWMALACVVAAAFSWWVKVRRWRE